MMTWGKSHVPIPSCSPLLPTVLSASPLPSPNSLFCFSSAVPTHSLTQFFLFPFSTFPFLFLPTPAFSFLLSIFYLILCVSPPSSVLTLRLTVLSNVGWECLSAPKMAIKISQHKFPRSQLLTSNNCVLMVHIFPQAQDFLQACRKISSICPSHIHMLCVT